MGAAGQNPGWGWKTGNTPGKQEALRNLIQGAFSVGHREGQPPEPLRLAYHHFFDDDPVADFQAKQVDAGRYTIEVKFMLLPRSRKAARTECVAQCVDQVYPGCCMDRQLDENNLACGIEIDDDLA